MDLCWQEPIAQRAALELLMPVIMVETPADPIMIKESVTNLLTFISAKNFLKWCRIKITIYKDDRFYKKSCW